jgi:two-component system chemotaxis response regulator CheB
MPAAPINVFLVEDSPIALKLLENLLTSSPDIHIAGTASNGIEALERIPEAQPDVICTDLCMEKMDGLELTQQLMAIYPRPILVISQVVDSHNSGMGAQLLKAGVIDILAKPKSSRPEDYQAIQTTLIQKIKVLAGVKVFTKPVRPALFTPVSASPAIWSSPLHTSQYKILLIGSSTGGPQALRKILTQLPAQFPLPIVCVQHISEGFLSGLVKWLDAECSLTVKIAEDQEALQPGHVYFAPDRHHLLFDLEGHCFYSAAAPMAGHRPAVDMTFQSGARVFGAGTIAALLTGIGRDGAQGLHKISQSGGLTIAQDEASSIIYGMPLEAVNLGAAKHVLDIHAIAPFILKSL